MRSEKIVAILLILAILFSVASVVFNLNLSELRQRDNTPRGETALGNLGGGINLVIAEGPEEAGK